jgi:hypothetical protein
VWHNTVLVFGRDEGVKSGAGAPALLSEFSPCRVSLVEPIPNSTKLRLNPAGLDALRKLPAPIAPVIVIGPYRSGKSFLINQMLQQRCGA